jgi:hypothetical protein
MNRIPPSAALVLVAAHLHTYDEPLLGPAARDLTGYVFAYLTREQPELHIVANWTCEWITWRHPVPEWLESNFRPMPRGHERGPFTRYVRRRGKLEARVVRSLAVK